MSLWLARAVPLSFDREIRHEIDPSSSLRPAARDLGIRGGPAAPGAGSGPRAGSAAASAGRAAQGPAEARAGARIQRERAQEGAEGGGQGRSQGDLREERGEVGRQQAARTVDRGADRRHRGDLAEPGRQPGRQGGRLRPPRGPLHDSDRRRRGPGAHPRRRLADAAPLQPGRQDDRLHQRPGGRRQHLAHGPRRRPPAGGHQGVVPPAQQPVLVAGRPVRRGPQALHRPALPRRRRDVALPPQRRRRPPAHQEAQRSEGRRRARLLARRPLRLFQPGRHAGARLRVQQGPQRRDLRHPAARPPDRQDRALRHRPRRRGPPHPVAGRQDARLHPPGAGQERDPPDGPPLRRGLAGLRRARPGHAGDLVDPRPLSVDGLDPGRQVARLLGRRQDPAARRRQPQGDGHPLPRPHHAAGRPGGALPHRGRSEDLRDPDAALGERLAEGGPRGLPGARPPVDPRPPQRQAAAADPPDRSLGGLPRLLARRPPGGLRHLGRREARHRARRARRRRRGAGGGQGARAVRRARLLTRRQADRLPQDPGGLRPHRRLVAQSRRLSGSRRAAASRR